MSRIHAVGAGGIGLSAALKLLARDGHSLSASDVEANEATAELADLGVDIEIGHRAENLPEGVQLLLFSDAVPEDNPERVEAVRRGLPQLSYFDFLGSLSAIRRTVGVSGTNGKSTTTAMLGQLATAGGLDPTVIVGSRSEFFPDGNLRLGGSDLLVVEACEYRANMLKLSTQTIVLTNLEADHLDFYRDLDHIKETFQKYLNRLPPDGLAVTNADDPNVVALSLPEGVRRVTFGFSSEADYRLSDIEIRSGEQSFQLTRANGQSLGRFSLRVPGRFNAMNAVAALATCLELGAPVEDLRRSLAEYKGIWRRFQRVGDFSGAKIVSDYGHTPTAVRETVRAAREFFPDKRIVLCFQPHHQNRTRSQYNEFAEALTEPDRLVLAEIYHVAGREAGEAQISSRQLAEEVRVKLADSNRRHSVSFAADPTEAEKQLRESLGPDDVAIIMGAGNIYRIAERLTQNPS